MKTEAIVHFTFVGTIIHFIPGFTRPCSTLPIAVVAPMSLYPSNMGILKGASFFLGSMSKLSKSSNNGGSVLHAGVFLFSLMLSPVRPLIGRNTTWSSLKPEPFMKGCSLPTISSYRSFAHSTLGSSILFTATTSFSTPKVLARSVCSRVWPPRSKPVSNSPFLAEIMSTPISACEAPAIIFGTYDLWPGASRIVKRLFGVSKWALPTSTVFPFAFSSSFVSMM
mmetsp:Transcript_44840/g.103728  ORF Transcript_44840/g.103728 Transcript_44840/m.103728 type:complete len:224 (+) Transcript_44840:533-1204(+)